MTTNKDVCHRGHEKVEPNLAKAGTRYQCRACQYAVSMRRRFETEGRPALSNHDVQEIADDKYVSLMQDGKRPYNRYKAPINPLDSVTQKLNEKVQKAYQEGYDKALQDVMASLNSEEIKNNIEKYLDMFKR